MPDVPNNRRTPAREPSKCLNSRATEKDWPKRPSDHQATKGSKKDSDRAITPAEEAVHVPAHLVPPGSPQAKQLRHLHAQLALGQSCHRQKHSRIYVHRTTSVVSDSATLSTLARLLWQGGGFSRQEHWSVLANAGCHTLLEHCISCCPSHQLP